MCAYRPEACCTCASLLADIKIPYDSKTEKPIAQNRQLEECCGRVICGRCIADNFRFATYCPFCQITSHSSYNHLLPQGLRDPPTYSPPHTPPPVISSVPTVPSSPPPYSSTLPSSSSDFSSTEAETEAEEVRHYLRPPHETLPSISLLYNVPTSILRTHNSLFSDTLLPGRRYILIPRSHYTGPTLSPEPSPASQEWKEEEHKTKVRRFMVRTKCVDYEVARLYLQNASWNVGRAAERWSADERWEVDHPLAGGGMERVNKSR